jgi:hypothetical protein
MTAVGGGVCFSTHAKKLAWIGHPISLRIDVILEAVHFGMMGRMRALGWAASW